MPALAKKAPARAPRKKEKSSRKDKKAAVSSLARQLVRRAEKVKPALAKPSHLVLVTGPEK